MPVRIRLAMHGPRHGRIFHIVAINQGKRRDAKPMETLGIYNPALELGETHKNIEWSVDRIKYWLGVGAQPSKSAVKLLTLGNLIPQDSQYHPKVTGPKLGDGWTTELKGPLEPEPQAVETRKERKTKERAALLAQGLPLPGPTQSREVRARQTNARSSPLRELAPRARQAAPHTREPRRA